MGPVITAKNRQELEEKGYTVVPDVLTDEECESYQQEYREWLKQFGDEEWPITSHSLIRGYGVAHLKPSWEVRMKARTVYAQLWGTDQLLSSLDAVAIGRPPEDGKEEWWQEGEHWLHNDQSAARKGLHAYQGAVYLEQTDEQDWTFEVLEGSHKLHDEFFDSHPKAKISSNDNLYYNLLNEDTDWYINTHGCQSKRVAVPKGGMVLWDSRLIHANARPQKGRPVPRWRWVVIVCMGPVGWTTPADLAVKRDAYRQLLMTYHWPCLGVEIMKKPVPSDSLSDRLRPRQLPEVAKTEVARRLMGDLNYQTSDGFSLPKPEWSNSD